MSKNIQDDYHRILDLIENNYYELEVAAEENSIANGEEPRESYPGIEYAISADILAVQRKVYKDVLDSGQIREKGQVLAEILKQTKSITLSSNKISIGDVDLDQSYISPYLEYLEDYTFNNKTSFAVYRTLNGLRIFQYHTIYDDLKCIVKILQDIKADPDYIDFVLKTGACHARLTPKNDRFMDYWNFVKDNGINDYGSTSNYNKYSLKVSEMLEFIYYDKEEQKLITKNSRWSKFPVISELERVKKYYEHHTRSYLGIKGVLAQYLRHILVMFVFDEEN